MILQALTQLGPSKPKDVMAVIVDRHNRNITRTALYESLRRLAKCGRVIRRPDGKWATTAPYDEFDQSNFTYYESQVVEFIKANGGGAKTSENHKAVWGGFEPGMPQSRPYDYAMVVRVQKESKLVSQDWGRGTWNLSQAELAKVPITGRWVMRQISKQFNKPDCHASVEAQQEYCLVLGNAFADARSDIPVYELVDDPAIGEALDSILQTIPTVLRMEIEKAAYAHTQTRSGSLEQWTRAATYLRFEAGDIAVQRIADAAFFNACAAVFGISAAELSRKGLDTLSVVPKLVGGVAES
jgi:hypothetical protein